MYLCKLKKIGKQKVSQIFYSSITWPHTHLPIHTTSGCDKLCLALPPCSSFFHSLFNDLTLLSEIEVHLVVDVLPLWVELLEDLCKNIDRLLTAQSSAFGLELLQQVFSGHGFSDQITAHRLLGQLHITERQEEQQVSVSIAKEQKSLR